MRKIKIALSLDECSVMCQILSKIATLSPGRVKGLEIEILLCQEFYMANMARLEFPLEDKRPFSPQNKFTLRQSEALAILKIVMGYDMALFDTHSQVIRDSVCNMLSVKTAHIFKHTATPAEHE